MKIKSMKALIFSIQPNQPKYSMDFVFLCVEDDTINKARRIKVLKNVFMRF